MMQSQPAVQEACPEPLTDPLALDEIVNNVDMNGM